MVLRAEVFIRFPKELHCNGSIIQALVYHLTWSLLMVMIPGYTNLHPMNPADSIKGARKRKYTNQLTICGN